MSRFFLLIVFLEAVSATLLLGAESSAQGKSIYEIEININIENASIIDAFHIIESKTEFIFSYYTEVIDPNTKVSVRGKLSFGRLLEDISKQTNLKFRRINDNIHVYKKEAGDNAVMEEQFSLEQDMEISGLVTDENGEPLPGATILVKGSSTGAVTDMEGKFRLDVKEGQILIISFVGYKSMEVTVGTETSIQVQLQPDMEQLDEIVVVGYGMMKKSSLTGAVSQVDDQTLNVLPTGNALEAMQGKVAGVSIGAVTEPGGNPSIIIRGTRSLNASNSPLYVIDGIPRSAGSTISDIPVNDIQSIEILKDAASTAIYGSRGANGVILVTTKRGKINQPMEIAINSYVGVNEAILPEMMSGDQYVQYRRDVARAQQGWDNGYPADETIFYPGELNTIQNRNYADWQDLIFRNGINQRHNVSLSHGSEKSQIYLSLGYMQDEGYYKTSKNEKINVTLNVDYSLLSNLKVGLSSRMNNSGTDGFSSVGALSLAYMNPLAQPYDDNGNLIFFPAEVNSNQFNILANYENPYKNETSTLKGLYILYADWEVLEGLKLRSNLSVGIDRTEEDVFRGTYSFEQQGRTNYAQQSKSSTNDFVWDNIVSYLKDFGPHSINLTAVTSIQSSTLKESSASGEGFPTDEINSWNLNAATSNIVIDSYYRNYSLVSYLGRFQYEYQHKYIINGSIRADGSSVLADGNKWGYFPSLSGAWVVSRENFFSEVAAIDNLKLRASFGKVGNSAIDPYSTIATASQRAYNFGDSYYYGYSLGGLSNPSLGWEYSTTTNIGLEFSLLNYRITGSFEAYKTKTKDLLMQRSLPIMSGFSSVYQNLGETSNTGLEISLSTLNIQSEKFNWSTDFNLYTNKEKIEKLITNEDMEGNNWFIGEPLNVFYDFQKIGIWQLSEQETAEEYLREPGDIKIKDQNNDGIVDASNDMVILGQSAPKLNLFMRNSFSYGNITFAFALESKLGHMVNSDMLGRYLFYDGQRQMPESLYGNYWTPDNPTSEYPRVGLTSEPPNKNITGYRKAGYVNVQEISLGYTFNEIRLFKTLEVFARIKNPFYLHREDKDINPQAPGFDVATFRTTVFGLNATL